MNKLELALLRKAATPSITADEPGSLTLHFGAMKLLPAGIQPHLHHVEEAAAMLPGVTGASLAAATGDLTIRYDAAQTDSAAIRQWMNTVIDTCLNLANSPDLQGRSVDEIAVVVRDKLHTKLPI